MQRAAHCVVANLNPERLTMCCTWHCSSSCCRSSMQRAARCVAAACPGADGGGAGPAKLPQPPAGGCPPSSVCIASDSRCRHSLHGEHRQ